MVRVEISIWKFKRYDTDPHDTKAMEFLGKKRPTRGEGVMEKGQARVRRRERERQEPLS